LLIDENYNEVDSFIGYIDNPIIVIIYLNILSMKLSSV